MLEGYTIAFATSALIETLPMRVPVPVGVELTAMVQLCPAARLAPQLLVREKSPYQARPSPNRSEYDCYSNVQSVVLMAVLFGAVG
jgi:hypothetical protein